MVTRATAAVGESGLDYETSILLMDLLVQLVEADGTVRASETQFVRALVDVLALDRAALMSEYPEWATYLKPGLKGADTPHLDLRGAYSSAFDRADFRTRTRPDK